MDVRKTVGDNFARIRREKGLTQEKIEELSGFSQQYLSGLERGKRNPTIVSLYELSVTLSVDLEEFFKPVADTNLADSRVPDP